MQIAASEARRWLLICVALLAALVDGQVEREEPMTVKKFDRENFPKAMPIDEDMTRLLIVDYWFRTESVLFDVMDNKESAPSVVVAGNISFETLHHDMDGGMLGRMTITECKSGNCGVTPPLYMAFRQGGNNVEEILVDLKDYPDYKPTWNFLYGIANTIYTPAEYGEGDEQVVNTVYGRCKTHFGRPEDKRFRRKINACELGYNKNFTRFPGIEIVDYDQDVWYTQNTKVDADIVLIDAIEMLTFRIPFDKKHGFVAESRTHVEITNRTKLYVPKHCPTETSAAECAKTKFGATKVGKKLYEEVRIGSDYQPGHLVDLVKKYREAHDASTFAQLAQIASAAPKEEWTKVLSREENHPISGVLANVLGSTGDVEALKLARDVLLTASTGEQRRTLLDNFLFGAAHASSINEKWHKQLMYWLGDLEKEKDSDEFWKLANTLATVLWRRCEASTSNLNACNKGKDLVVSKFVATVAAHENELERVFDVLFNLPIVGAYKLAKDKLCAKQTSKVQMAALKLIRRVDSAHYEGELVHRLIRVFRNTCATSSTTSESQVAVDILLRCLPEHQNAATLLLRTESLHPDDQEKWQYVYKAIRASGEKDDLKQELWKRMRQFKVFRPNYKHRSLAADSLAHWQTIAEVAGFKFSSWSAVEFARQSFRRTDTDLSIRRHKREESVYSVSLETDGLDLLATPDTPSASLAEPEAVARLGLLGHALPKQTVFKGNTDVLAAYWSADGGSKPAFQGHVPLRDTILAVPLLSGLTLDVTSSGALSLHLQSATEVSLWHKDSAAVLQANVSAALVTTATLRHHMEPIRVVHAEFVASSALRSHVDARFDRLPVQFCFTTEQDDIRIKAETIIDDVVKPKKRVTTTRRKSHPAMTYRLDELTTAKCNQHLLEAH